MEFSTQSSYKSAMVIVQWPVNGSKMISADKDRRGTRTIVLSDALIAGREVLQHIMELELGNYLMEVKESFT